MTILFLIVKQNYSFILKIEQYQSELNSLRTSKADINESTIEELKNMTKELNDLKLTHTIVQKQLHTNQRIMSKLKLAKTTALTNYDKLQIELKNKCDNYEKQLNEKSNEIQRTRQKLKQIEMKLQEANNKVSFFLNTYYIIHMT